MRAADSHQKIERESAALVLPFCLIIHSKILVLVFVAFEKEIGMFFYLSHLFFVWVKGIGRMWDLGLRINTLFVISIFIYSENFLTVSKLHNYM